MPFHSAVVCHYTAAHFGQQASDLAESFIIYLVQTYILFPKKLDWARPRCDISFFQIITIIHHYLLEEYVHINHFQQVL